LVKGLTSADLGPPDYQKALEQHDAYIAALESCGLEVAVLPQLEDFPDSCFIEDVALLTPRCGIITRPGAPSRVGEIRGMSEILNRYFDAVEVIQPPGTLEGGDILAAGSHYYIGLSGRTNSEGARQLIGILEKYGFSASVVPLEESLHLKTAVSYLEDNSLLAAGELLAREEFSEFKRLAVPDEEAYAANCIWVNGVVLVPAGFPRTAQMILEAGFDILVVDVSEFRKLDGGLSCLSLRF